MRELNDMEIEQVNGGVAPFIGAAIALYSHFTATTVTSAIVSRVGLAVAIYDVGEYLSDS